MKRSVFFAFAVTLFSVPSRADVLNYYPSTTLRLGSTFDPLDLTSVKPPCLRFDTEAAVDGVNQTAVASDVQFTIRQIHDRRELSTLTSNSISIAGHYKAFSADGSYSAEDSFDSTSNSLSWALVASSKFGRFRAVNIRFTEEVKDLIQQKRYTDVIERCGLEAVLQVTRGISIAAIFTHHFTSEERRRSVEAEFNASFGGGMWGVSASAASSSYFKEAIERGEITMNVVGSGGAEGAAGLADLITKLKDDKTVDAVKTTLADYVKKNTADRSSIIQYQTGSLAAFAPALKVPDYTMYNVLLGEFFLAMQDNLAWLRRLREIYSTVDDYEDDIAKPVKDRYNTVRDRLFLIGKAARACRSRYQQSLGEIVSANEVRLTSPAAVVAAEPAAKGKDKGADKSKVAAPRAPEDKERQLRERVRTIEAELEDLVGVARTRAGNASEAATAFKTAFPQVVAECRFDLAWVDFTGFSEVPKLPFKDPIIWTNSLEDSPLQYLHATVEGVKVRKIRFRTRDPQRDLEIKTITSPGPSEIMIELTAGNLMAIPIDLVVTLSTGREYVVKALN